MLVGIDGIGLSRHAYRHIKDEGLHNRAEGGVDEVNVREAPASSAAQLAHGVT